MMSGSHTKHPAIASKASSLTGRATVPGDKSISHRALMLSSQVLGQSRISGLLEGEDVIATANALGQMGVIIEKEEEGDWLVDGVGIGGLYEPEDVLDMGNSGTGARLLMGLLASYSFQSVFTGDVSLRSRPMNRVITPLSHMGAQFSAREGGRLPLSLRGAQTAMPIAYELPVASAQVKSAIILAALNTPGTTKVIEPALTRDHTERMLNYLGIKVRSEIRQDGAKVIKVQGHQMVSPQDRVIEVPADPSSAAFLIVAALLCPNSSIELMGVCMNPLRTGLFDTLQDMGASLSYSNEREQLGEPVADIVVKTSSLKGVTVPASRAPSMIDEYPILAVAAAHAKGDTVMEGLEELRVKESDRLQAIMDGLEANEVRYTLSGDTLIVHGTGGQIAGGGEVVTHFDHRIAMSFIVMGLVSDKPVKVDDTAAISTSFPDFVPLMRSIGAPIERRFDTTRKPKAPRRVIAIDGPAASGKGTLARKLADHYGYAYLDTGSLYRAVGLRLTNNQQSPDDKESAIRAAKAISRNDLSNPSLRKEKVGQAASVVSAMPEVRQILLDYQLQFANRPEGAILDGRDIGTVVCPEADVKLYVTASVDARAKRRHKQLQDQGIEVVYESVLRDLVERDERDQQRDTAPLKPADDAIEIDTTDMSIHSVFNTVTETVEGTKIKAKSA